MEPVKYNLINKEEGIDISNSTKTLTMRVLSSKGEKMFCKAFVKPEFIETEVFKESCIKIGITYEISTAFSSSLDYEKRVYMEIGKIVDPNKIFILQDVEYNKDSMKEVFFSIFNIYKTKNLIKELTKKSANELNILTWYFILQKLIETNDVSDYIDFVVTEIVGEQKDFIDLDEYMGIMKKEEIDDIMTQIFLGTKVLRDNRIKHNDLHLGNVLIYKHEREFKIKAFNMEKNYKSKFLVKIFDFDQSYVESLQDNKLLNNNFFKQRFITNGFDPRFDGVLMTCMFLDMLFEMNNNKKFNMRFSKFYKIVKDVISRRNDDAWEEFLNILFIKRRCTNALCRINKECIEDFEKEHGKIDFDQICLKLYMIQEDDKPNKKKRKFIESNHEVENPRSKLLKSRARSI